MKLLVIGRAVVNGAGLAEASSKGNGTFDSDLDV